MKKIKEILKTAGVFGVVSILPIVALAQTGGAPATPGPAGHGQGSNVATNVPPVQINSVQNVLDLVCVIFGWLFFFLIALSVVFIVIAAYRYLTSAGNAEKVKDATNIIIYAAVAVAVALLARAIPLIVGNFLGAGGFSGGGLLSC